MVVFAGQNGKNKDIPPTTSNMRNGMMAMHASITTLWQHHADQIVVVFDKSKYRGLFPTKAYLANLGTLQYR